MGILTGGVLAFQALIVISMLFAASSSRTALNVTTTLWVLFTLFGSIHTGGLMLLQLITITAGYNWRARFVPAASEAKALTFSRLTSGTWDFIRYTIIICLIIGWLISEYVK